MLLGESGSGKTTLMRQITETLEGDREIAWLNAALADSAADLLTLAVKSLAGNHPPFPIDETEGSFRLLTLTRALAAQAPAVIVVDNLSDAEVAFDLFGRLRDELWAAGHTWLVAVRPVDSVALRSPPAEAFWATVVEIPPFDEREALEFLHRGLDEDELGRLHHETFVEGFYPRLLIREVEDALDQEEREDGMRIGALLVRASELGGSEELALVELINLNRPASAHDPELLDKLGWSRAYTQRLFSNLESAGLVRSLPAASGERTGRPRKLYEPKLRPYP